MLRETAHRTVRLFRRSPAFAIVAVLSLAAGLGVSTAALALVEGARRGPELQVADIDRFFRLRLMGPTTFKVVSAIDQIAALLAAVTMLAALLPAVPAMRVDPVKVLRAT